MSSSNRTFMELKLQTIYWWLHKLHGSNRTFMELKCQRCARMGLSGTVLIAPLWN